MSLKSSEWSPKPILFRSNNIDQPETAMLLPPGAESTTGKDVRGSRVSANRTARTSLRVSRLILASREVLPDRGTKTRILLQQRILQ